MFPGQWEEIPENAHTVFSFAIPYAIPVPDGMYRVRVTEHTAEISLRRVQNTQIRGYVVRASGRGYMQFPFDKYGRSSYSQIEMKIPFKINLFEEGRKPLLLGDIPRRSKDKEVVLHFLNRFIEAVRYVTQEYWIEPIRYQDITEYEVSYWDGKQRYSAVTTGLSFGTGGVAIGTGHPFIVKDEKMREIANILENELELDVSNIFLLNSKDACLQEDFRLAIVESVTALEMVLDRFIRKQSKNLGVSNEKIESFIVDVGLTGNITVALKMLAKGMEQIDNETVQKCTGAITIRNNILHKGLKEITPSDAEERIISIEKMITYLKRLIASV
jgi:hypothetical protein